MMPSPAVEVRGLTKTYGGVCAVDNVSFEVAGGEIFGLLGPNGAGKTTVIECLATLRHPDRGAVRVLGLDPRRDAAILRRRIGVQLQSAALPKRATLREALGVFGSFYPDPMDWHTLVTQVGLADVARTPFARLSGGQQQRAFIALALVNRPRIVFLDELTTSLDPHAKHGMWDLVRTLRARDTTIFLTTHCMEEAANLCDRIAIMHQGRIIALGPPAEIVRRSGIDHRMSFRTAEKFRDELVDGLPSVRRVEREDDIIVVYGPSDQLVSDVIGHLAERGVRCLDVQFEPTTLEDVFLDLTGTTTTRPMPEDPCADCGN